MNVRKMPDRYYVSDIARDMEQRRTSIRMTLEHCFECKDIPAPSGRQYTERREARIHAPTATAED